MKAAAFFARLASISSWLDLSDGQVRLLKEEFVSIWPRTTTLEEGELPMGQLEIERKLRGILEGEEVDPVLGGLTRWQLKGSKVEEVVAAEVAGAFGRDGLQWRADLRNLVLEDPFPFRRCERCGSVFVFVKAQRYCTPICARGAAEAARKGTRREYMRQLMARKRERERAKTKKHRKER